MSNKMLTVAWREFKHTALTKAFTDEMLGRFETGGLKPIVDAVLPMTDVQTAHQRMDANETFGKLVLAW